MHLFDAARRFYGGNAIVGGGLPIAVGLALADKMQRRPRVTACFFGDGAVAEGEFHESLNLAALWKLPVLFLCENNLYAMGTALERAQSQTDLRCARPRATASRPRSVDGMDVARRRGGDAARPRRPCARGDGPAFLEFRTYRFRAHSMFDPELYRDKAEVEEWKERDPIATVRRRAARARGSLDDARSSRASRPTVAAEIDDGGRSSPRPAPGSRSRISTDVTSTRRRRASAHA